MKNRHSVSSIRVLMLGLLVVAVSPAIGQQSDPRALFEAASTRADGTVEYLELSGAEAPDGKLGARALELVASHAARFGLSDVQRQMTVSKVSRDFAGNHHVRLGQHHKGVPVEGGELIVHFDRKGSPTSITGVTVPALDIDVIPAIRLARAVRVARHVVAEGLDHDVQLKVSGQRLVVYNDGLVRGVIGDSHLSYEITVTAPGVRKFVYVDAVSADVVAILEGVITIKDRETYDMNGGSSYAAAVLARDEGDGPVGDTDVDNAHDFAGDTYDLFANAYGRDSIDGAGFTLKSYAHYFSFFICPNAFWDGARMTYCDGFAVDDVTGHEISHGLTEFTADLVYQYQPGALSEGLSDEFGEAIDLLNGVGSDGPADRWLIGEDIPGFGAIRDMEDPPAFGDPDRVGSPLYYCGSADSGGVHTNSGVPNKAFSLLTDGGLFNGRDVFPIGLTKTTAFHYYSLTNYSGRYTQFRGHFIGLWRSCIDLVGTELNDPLTGLPSGEVVSIIDCFQVLKAGLAVEFLTPACP